jgi:hypothetical protein
MSMNDKMYMVNGVPASANDIIRQAEYYSDEFANGWLKQTGVASDILRDYGYEVSENPEWKKDNTK